MATESGLPPRGILWRLHFAIGTDGDFFLGYEAGMKILVKRGRVVPAVTPEASSMWRLQRPQSCLLSLRRALPVLVGVLLAILTRLGLAFGSEYLDPTFRTPDEVTSFLNIPVLATMPQNRKNGVLTGSMA